MEKVHLTQKQANSLEMYKSKGLNEDRNTLNAIIQFSEDDELWAMINALQYGYEIVEEPKYKVVLSNGQTLVKGSSGEYYFDFLGEYTDVDTQFSLDELSQAEDSLNLEFGNITQISVQKVEE